MSLKYLIRMIDGSQLELGDFMFPYNQPKANTEGLEQMLINDSCGLVVDDCIVCGNKFKTNMEAFHRACDPCNKRK